MIRWPMRTDAGQLLAVVVLELRLVVEQVDVRRPARHEQVDDALRLRRRSECRQGAVRPQRRPRRRRRAFVEQRRQRRVPMPVRSGRRTGGGSECRIVISLGGPGGQIHCMHRSFRVMIAISRTINRMNIVSNWSLRICGKSLSHVLNSWSPSRRGSGSCWRPSSRRPARGRRGVSSRGDSPTGGA